MPNEKATKKVKRPKQPDPKLKTYRMPEVLVSRIADAAAATGLKPADIVRLSIDRGIDALISQLSKPMEVAE